MCEMKFFSKSSLKMHRLTHETSLKYECPVCSKRLKARANLAHHLNLHTDRYACGLCGKRSSTKQGLREHMKTHTGERNFKCALCDAGFPDKSGLKEHLVTHRQERPYECRICLRRFKLKKAVNSHLKQGHRTCEICNEEFCSRYVFRRHLKAHAD